MTKQARPSKRATVNHMIGDKRPTAVLLHGFLGSSTDWQPFIDHLSSQVQCVTPSLLDYPTIEALETSIRQKTPEPAILIGYSMGSRLALHLLLRDPQHYRLGVLASSSPGLPTAARRSARRKDDARIAERLRGISGTDDLHVFLKEWYAQEIFAGVARHPCYSEMLKRRLKIDPCAWATTLTRLGTGSLPSLWKKLPSLRQPTLALAGTQDRHYVAIARKMEECATAIRTRLLPDCGHAVLCCKPTEFATKVATFLDEEL